MFLLNRLGIKIAFFMLLSSISNFAIPLIGVNRGKCEAFYFVGSELPNGWRLNFHYLNRLNEKQRPSFYGLGKKWDVAEMDHTHLPTPVAKVENLALISQIKPQQDKIPRSVEGIGATYSSAKEGFVEGINTQDMLIKIPNPPGLLAKPVRIPKELQQFEEVISRALDFDQENNPNHELMYAYITISQSVVKGGRAQRRRGAHVDGLDETTYLKHDLIPDHTYIVSSSIPTHFFDQPFPLRNVKYGDTLQYFDNVADPRKIVTYEPGVIALMDSYTVHEVGTATEALQPRTFIKITFSFNRFAMAGNSLNLLFKDEYTNPSSPWVWKSRGKGRNSTSK